MNKDELIAELVEALRDCNALGSFNRRGEREVVLTFTTHASGNRAFESLDRLSALARNPSS